jgi:hypothetical protein
MNTINRAHINAGSIFNIYTRLADDICHNFNLLSIDDCTVINLIAAYNSRQQPKIVCGAILSNGIAKSQGKLLT